MSILTQAHYLDLVPELRAPVVVHVSQGDSGNTIKFNILRQGEAYNFTTESVVVHGMRQDGANFGPFTCTKSGDSISFQTRTSMTAIEGSAIAEISIVDSSGAKVGTANFAILVEQTSFPNGVTYSNDPSVYEAILSYAQSVDSSSKTGINNLRATLENEISTFETTVNNRVNQIVSQAGTDNTEIVDSRVTFKNVAKTNLKLRLNEFLEFDTVGTTDGIGTIGDLEEEITEIVINWLNTHPANLVYASDGTIARYIIRSTSDIDY